MMKQYLHYLAAALPLANFAVAQKAGTQQTETHPKLTWSKCTGPGACTSVNAEVVIDANWRWLHDADQTNCYDGNEWTDACSSADDCAELCELEGADYDGTYGASTSGDALSLSFLTKHEYGTNIGSRFYLMDGSDKYQMFDLLGNEFAFDVDLSTVECGLNSALYFVAMEEDGGLASYPSNTAGAKYGTGVCCLLTLLTLPSEFAHLLIINPNSTATRNAPVTSSSSVARVTLKAGSRPPTTPTPVSVPLAVAALRSMFG